MTILQKLYERRKTDVSFEWILNTTEADTGEKKMF